MKVTLVAAISLDGYINRALDSPIDFTSPEDKKFFFSECARTGVAIMGANTHANHKQPIPNCLNIVMTKDALSAQRAEGRVMPTTCTPYEIIKALTYMGHNEVTLLGGGRLNTAFLAAGLITDLYLTITPHYFGSGIPLFHMPVELELQSSNKLSQHELLNHYRIKTTL